MVMLAASPWNAVAQQPSSTDPTVLDDVEAAFSRIETRGAHVTACDSGLIPKPQYRTTLTNFPFGLRNHFQGIQRLPDQPGYLAISGSNRTGADLFIVRLGDESSGCDGQVVARVQLDDVIEACGRTQHAGIDPGGADARGIAARRQGGVLRRRGTGVAPAADRRDHAAGPESVRHGADSTSQRTLSRGGARRVRRIAAPGRLLSLTLDDAGRRVPSGACDVARLRCRSARRSGSNVQPLPDHQLHPAGGRTSVSRRFPQPRRAAHDPSRARLRGPVRSAVSEGRRSRFWSCRQSRRWQTGCSAARMDSAASTRRRDCSSIP